jgi:hypothetical protein
VINGEVRATAHHPGTKGKHPWAKGVESARPIVKALYSQALHSELVRLF